MHTLVLAGNIDMPCAFAALIFSRKAYVVPRCTAAIDDYFLNFSVLSTQSAAHANVDVSQAADAHLRCLHVIGIFLLRNRKGIMQIL